MALISGWRPENTPPFQPSKKGFLSVRLPPPWMPDLYKYQTLKVLTGQFCTIKGDKDVVQLRQPRAYRHRKWEKDKRGFAGAAVWCSVAICLTCFIRKIDLLQMPEKRQRQRRRERKGEGGRCLRFESAQIKFIDTSSLRWLSVRKSRPPILCFPWQQWTISSGSSLIFTGGWVIYRAEPRFVWLKLSGIKNSGRIKGRRKQAAPLNNPQPT